LNERGIRKINVLIAIPVEGHLDFAEVVAIQREKDEFLGEQGVKETIPFCRGPLRI
jgi:hypothetical protein